MFSFFKKKPPVPALAGVLQLGDRDFVAAVVQMLADGPLASGTMCLVALENFKTLMQVSWGLAKTKPDKEVPQTLDEFIIFLATALERPTDELSKRRVQWFYLAALIKRVSVKATANPSLMGAVAAIWVRLARSGTLLAEAIPRNQLWSEDEKQYFSHIKDERAGVGYVLAHMLPVALRHHSDIEALAEEYDVSIPLR